ncbi:MAG: neutral zinc metallopeptidase [Planctomycetaceae bacterium]|jgi:predicted metalloprotease
MRLENQRASENIEDRRGLKAGPVLVGGGLSALFLALLVSFLGGDPQKVLQQQGQQGGRGGRGAETQQELTAEEVRMGEFVKRILGSTEDVWTELFPKEIGKRYKEPTLVMFSGQTKSACGFANAAVGPFYCPADQKVYIDLAFYDELKNKFRAPGDFAQAYVIAHEIGHHVQNQLGLTDKVHSRQGRVSKEEFNQLSVRLELQADYLAGVWAHHAQKTKGILEPGDLKEGLVAATAIGDDRLQMQAQGYVVPDSFTHGTSEQRLRWFAKGLKAGTIEGFDTFSIPFDQL